MDFGTSDCNISYLIGICTWFSLDCHVTILEKRGDNKMNNIEKKTTVSQAQIKASRKYEQKNPERTGYNRLKREAFNFIDALEKPKTTAYRYITSDYGQKKYVEHLKELRDLIDEHLKEIESKSLQGVVEENKKRLEEDNQE